LLFYLDLRIFLGCLLIYSAHFVKERNGAVQLRLYWRRNVW